MCVFRAARAFGGENEVSYGEGAGSDCQGREVGRTVWCEPGRGHVHMCVCVGTYVRTVS